MNLETTELTRVSQRFALPGIRWGAVMAGMAVAVGAYVFLMLLAACAGLAVLSTDQGSRMDVQGLALVWNLLSALAASAVGAAIAARAADLRRHLDGVLHGLVVWGVSVLVASAMAIAALHGVSNSMSSLLQLRAVDDPVALEQMDRDMPYPRTGSISRAAIPAPVLMDAVVDPGRRDYRFYRPSVAPVPSIDPGRVMGASMYLALMICSAVAMALCGGIAGGVLGTRAPRRPDPLDHGNWHEAIGLLKR